MSQGTGSSRRGEKGAAGGFIQINEYPTGATRAPRNFDEDYSSPAGRGDTMGQRYYESETSPAWYNVKEWSGRRKLTVGLIAAAVIALAIAIPVVVVRNQAKANSYPAYAKLNYALADTCE